MDKYFFDKRVLKRFFIRYGIMFLIALPVLIAVSFLLENLSSGVRILIYIAILITFVILCEVINNTMLKKQKLKEEESKLAEKQAKKQNRNNK